MLDIEKDGASSVGDFHDHLTGEQVANIVFGQQHSPGASEDLRLVVANPLQLGRREAR